MTFEEILDQAIAMLQRRGRLTYGTLKRQFQLDDAALEDLKNELIDGQRLAVDEQGNVLVWTGAEVSVPHPTAPPASSQDRPRSPTPRQHLAEKILTTRSTLEGERKPVTVLFCDLKLMTSLADRDPEEARQLLDPLLERLMDAVHRYEGTVNQFLGDGFMALFGAPIAYEDHAVRACYAALTMQAAMRRYADEVRRSHGLAVQIRVGLNSGEVVAAPSAMTCTWITPRSARRRTWRPGRNNWPLLADIMLDAATLRLVEGNVQVQALGPVPVKGLADLVEVFGERGHGLARACRQLSPVG